MQYDYDMKEMIEHSLEMIAIVAIFIGILSIARNK
jgi:hypothetical protein